MTAIAVVTTVGDKKEARRMAHALVEAKLAACAQISRIESVYAWKGKIESGKEYRVLFKTLEACYPAVERAIRELHSYELPAIHAFAFEHVSKAYVDWIEASVGQGAGR
jgi:periplasmic divalent cation tolerance protein